MRIDRHEIGPRYAGAVRHGDLAYVAGQVAVQDPDGDIRVQTEEVLHRIDALLAAAGTSRSRLLSVSVWLADFADYAGFNETWDAWVDREHLPARATVRAELLDPRLRVEVAAVAAVPAVTGIASGRDGVASIEVAEILSGHGDANRLLVDVREQHERDTGHIPGSLHAPRGYLEFHLDPTSDHHLPALLHGKSLVMVCGSGGRARLAAELVSDLGLDACVLNGGMRAWRDADGPVTA